MSRVIKFADESVFEKLKKLKKVYNINTYTKLIHHLCDLALEKHLIDKE